MTTVSNPISSSDAFQFGAEVINAFLVVRWKWNLLVDGVEVSLA
jgi:hypothetical protein